MFRTRLRDFNSRVYDELRRTCILEDKGSHHIVLSLMKDTIEKINSEYSAESKAAAAAASALAADVSAVNISAIDAAGVKRGLKIIESATKKERFDNSRGADNKSAAASSSVVSAAAQRRNRRHQQGKNEKKDDDDDDDDDENDPSLMALGGTAEFEKFKSRQEAEELYQAAVSFVMQENAAAAAGSSSMGGLSSDDLDALVSVL